ncbi:MAG: DNA cytosine methyltransferase [Actinomycetaceae bacterium]|nr:DNA cytosine methyltransferase [Actinomycetaceae bacterium]
MSAPDSSLRLVLEPEGFRLLESLSARGAYDAAQAQAIGAGLRRRGVSSDLVAAVLTQWQLRGEAVSKFGPFADSMLFTREGLEQATRLPVAGLHAARFREAGCGVVADLGCGIGADSMALGALGIGVRAFDMDEAAASCALVNLRPFADVQVTVANVVDMDVAGLGVDGVFADPARRGARGRLKNPEDWSPPLSLVLAWADLVPGRNLGVKVAPGIDYGLIPGDGHAQWVSFDGEVLEAGLWFGDLRGPGGPGRSAVVMRSIECDPQSTSEVDAHTGFEQNLPVRHGLRTHVLVDPDCTDPSQPAATVETGALGKYVWEADGAVLRAGLLNRVAELGGARGLVSPGIAYLCADTLPGAEVSPFVECFEVLDVLPLQVKALRQWARANDVTSLEIKKRGADVSPEKLRAQVLHGAPKPADGQGATLIATRVNGKHQALWVRRTHTS